MTISILFAAAVAMHVTPLSAPDTHTPAPIERRIAADAGTQLPEVNKLVKQFSEMQKLMKQLSGGGKRGALGSLMGGRR